MGWSTREVAHLAGTTLRTVRHYHAIGLLDEPERQANGYKDYRAEHLVRLLQIRRLTRLGLSLGTIAAIDREAASPDLDETLASADDELATTIAQLQEAREEIARLRSNPTPIDLPFEVSTAATEARLSQTDRALYTVVEQAIGDDGSPFLTGVLRDFRPDEATTEFDGLPADADEDTRQALALRMAPQLAALMQDRAAAAVPLSRQQAVANTVIDTMLDLYNPAQLDVIARIWKATGVL